MKNLFCIISLLITFGVIAQTNTFPNTGNVGVNTTSPQFRLHLKSDAFRNGMTLGAGANTADFAMTASDGGAYGFFGGVYSNGNSWFQVGRWDANTPYHLLLQSSGGNVGIGTTNPSYKLDVSGQIQASYGGGYPIIRHNNTNPGTYGLDEYTENGIEKAYIGMGGSSQFFGSNAAYSQDGFSINSDGSGVMNISNRGSSRTIYLNTGSEGSSDFHTVTIANGSVGIGTINPTQKVTVNGAIESLIDSYGEGGQIILRGNNNRFNIDNYGGNSLRIFKEDDATGTNGQVLMNIASNGNVLIGKTSQLNSNYKLDVAGNIRANKLVVNTTGADYVFEKNYQLKPLNELETYIKEHKHLPGIASAKEMQDDGLSVGDNQTKLLEKIEELSLYLIEQNKKIKNMGMLIEQQQTQILELKKFIK